MKTRNYRVFVEPDTTNMLTGRRHAADADGTFLLCGIIIRDNHTFIRNALTEPTGITCVVCSAKLSERYWTRQAVSVGEGFEIGDGRRAEKPPARTRAEIKRQSAAKIAAAEADARANPRWGVHRIAYRHRIARKVVQQILARVRAEHRQGSTA